MAYSFKGSLSFGLVYIPVTLHSAVKEGTIGFNMLDRKTMSRVKYKKTCVDCGDREVMQEDIVKGYEYEDGKYVVFEDADFEKLKTQKDKNITIDRFVDVAGIDPIYYDKPYYVAPTGAEKAFKVLVRAMEEEKKVGIAKTVLGTKETLVAVRADRNQLFLNTLFFYDEIQQNPAKNASGEIPEKELNMAKAIIEGMTEPFDASQYKDEYRERVEAAIARKIAGQEIVRPREEVGKGVENLMDALEITLKKLDKPGENQEDPKEKEPPVPKKRKAR